MDDAIPRPDGAFAAAAGCALAVTRITLTNFRSYTNAALSVAALPVVLTGPNGAGKTNLLEAISLLSPGRGLRGAKLAAIQRKAPAERAGSENAFADALWAVSASIARPDGDWELGTGLLPTDGHASARRTLHLNQAAAGSAEVAELLPMLWLTPAMDRLFLEGASDRRRFLDRLVFTFDSAHARRMTRYERAMQQRLKLLRDGVRDRAWLDGLETSMAEDGAAVSAARLSLIEKLNGELGARGAEGAFPCAHLSLQDALGESATDAARLGAAFASSRERDAEAGRTNCGPHLSDLEVRHTLKRADARDCSTGEQKALLISIVLANGWLQRNCRDGIAPVMLLDEIAAHLDAKRRAALFEELRALGTQAWLTGTDRSLFATLEDHAAFFSVDTGRFVPGMAVM